MEDVYQNYIAKYNNLQRDFKKKCDEEKKKEDEKRKKEEEEIKKEEEERKRELEKRKKEEENRKNEEERKKLESFIEENETKFLDENFYSILNKKPTPKQTVIENKKEEPSMVEQLKKRSQKSPETLKVEKYEKILNNYDEMENQIKLLKSFETDYEIFNQYIINFIKIAVLVENKFYKTTYLSIDKLDEKKVLKINELEDVLLWYNQKFNVKYNKIKNSKERLDSFLKKIYGLQKIIAKENTISMTLLNEEMKGIKGGNNVIEKVKKISEQKPLDRFNFNFTQYTQNRPLCLQPCSFEDSNIYLFVGKYDEFTKKCENLENKYSNFNINVYFTLWNEHCDKVQKVKTKYENKFNSLNIKEFSSLYTFIQSLLRKLKDDEHQALYNSYMIDKKINQFDLTIKVKSDKTKEIREEYVQQINDIDREYNYESILNSIINERYITIKQKYEFYLRKEEILYVLLNSELPNSDKIVEEINKIEDIDEILEIYNKTIRETFKIEPTNDIMIDFTKLKNDYIQKIKKELPIDSIIVKQVDKIIDNCPPFPFWYTKYAMLYKQLDVLLSKFRYFNFFSLTDIVKREHFEKFIENLTIFNTEIDHIINFGKKIVTNIILTTTNFNITEFNNFYKNMIKLLKIINNNDMICNKKASDFIPLELMIAKLTKMKCSDKVNKYVDYSIKLCNVLSENVNVCSSWFDDLFKSVNNPKTYKNIFLDEYTKALDILTSVKNPMNSNALLQFLKNDNNLT